MRFALLLALLVGCHHDVRVRYPSSPEEPTGTLVLVLSQPSSNVSIAVNGLLVVEDADTKKITIEKLPTGNNEIVIASNGSDKAMRTWINSENPTTIPLGVPGSSPGFLKSLAGTIFTILVYSLLR